MNKREYITAIKPWKITDGEHTGKWLAGVQWTEGGEQKDRQIDRPRSTFHEAQRDADALTRKIEVEGMQGDYPPLVTTQARKKADAEVLIRVTEVSGTNHGLGHYNWSEEQKARVNEAMREDELRSQRDAAEQQISDAIDVMHDHGIDVSEGMVASVTTLAKAWSLLLETHDRTVQAAADAQAKAEKERDALRRNLEEAVLQQGKTAEDMEAVEDQLVDLRDARDSLAENVARLTAERNKLEAELREAVKNLDMARKNLSAACEQRDDARRKHDDAVKRCCNLGADLDIARKQARNQEAAVLDAASAAGIAGDDAVSSAAAMLNRISELSGMRAADTAVIESLGQECEDLRVKVAEQARVIAALHQALADAYGVPKS